MKYNNNFITLLFPEILYKIIVHNYTFIICISQINFKLYYINLKHIINTNIFILIVKYSKYSIPILHAKQNRSIT